MHLKTLSLAGFKSFVDRTRLAFEPGVTVIVGPNGSGKSNVVDSISWVMGTQAAKSLRTQRMDDVIFSGTALRPSLGRAEVSLTFDNAEGLLPLDLPEVTVTRRLYRDGTSEYEINGTQCRLLDIEELLADSGVGRHQHVIVGQGRIEAILGAGPEEHRAVVEEAAGVVKHRSRRDRSLRRLERTELDIQRLQDIAAEQERRMKPLRRQARAAERYESLRLEARHLRLFIAGEELRHTNQKRARAEAGLHAAERKERAGRAELARVKQKVAELEASGTAIRETLDRDTEAAARLETAIERLNRVAGVARERRRSVELRVHGAGERRHRLEAELADLRADLDRAGEDERIWQAALETRETQLLVLEDEERTLTEQAKLPGEGIPAALRADIRSLEAVDRRDRVEAEAIRRRVEAIGGRMQAEGEEANALRREIQTIDAAVVDAQEAYHTAKVTREQRQAAWEAAELAGHETRLELAHARARLEALETALADPGDPEARTRAQAVSGIVGTLRDHLKVPPALVPAVDAALGPWSEALLAAGPGEVSDTVKLLKSEGFGGIPLVAPRTQVNAPVPARRVAAEWGCEALIDLLGGDPLLGSRLLGDVLLVEGWGSAWRLVERRPDVRAVTPEGDLITADGVRIANPDGSTPASLEAAQVALEAAERDQARAESLLSSAQRSFGHARTGEREALEALEALEARLAGSTEALGLIERARSETEAEISRLGDREAVIVEASSARKERIGALERRVRELEGDEPAQQLAFVEMDQRRRHVAVLRQEARTSRDEAGAELAAAGERSRLGRDRVEAIESELSHAALQSTDPESVPRLADVEQRSTLAAEAIRGHIHTLRDRQRTSREQLSGLAGRLEAASDLGSQLESLALAARDEGSELKVDLAELRLRIEAVSEGLRRDADAGEDEALQAPPPELPEGVDATEHLATLDRRLKRLGPINPLAASEYRELEERAEFLAAQLEDLQASRSELRKVIEALDLQIETQFKLAYEEIGSLFEENFRLLFPGGTGRLRLTDAAATLTSGIEIEAQPLGKKVSRLSLLSGGERSLAALAFLFAVFRARPSPFYVLDEVEAALDDANLRRFMRLIDTLRDTAQLVIVTHQQQTMEAADILYGVTMEPGDSSQVVAKRLSEVRV